MDELRKAKLDWQAFIFDSEQNIIASMDNIAQKRFFDAELASAAVDATLDSLQKNNWEKLRKYEGRNAASARTFFFIVFRRSLEDHYRTLFGRCEPPKWAKLLGSFWSTLYKQLCCQGIEEQALLVTYHNSYDDHIIAKAIATIKQKDPKCLTRGKRVKTQSIDDDHNDTLTDYEQISSEASISVEEQDEITYEHIVHALHLWLSGDGAKPDQNEWQSQTVLAALRNLELDTTSILLLRLVFQENLKVPAAAKFVGIPEHTARRRVKEAKEKIAACFDQHEIHI